MQVYDSGHPKKICLPEPCLLEVGESTFKFRVMFCLKALLALIS